jgi:hypothetical protein
MSASQSAVPRCAPLVALLAVVAVIGLAPTASAAVPQVDGARAGVAPPFAVTIRINPNFKFVDDAARTSDDFTPPGSPDTFPQPGSTETVINLFPVFIFLLVVSAICLCIAVIGALATRTAQNRTNRNA